MQTLSFDDSRTAADAPSNGSNSDSRTIKIKRKLEQDHATLTIDCPPGKITLLQDSDTGCLLPYQNALAGLEEPGFELSLSSSQYNSRLYSLIGFGERLPDESILAHLTRSGVSPGQVEIALRRYELAQYNFLTCSQLSQTASRQVALLSACGGSKDILIMNDPFQPFSGRWREHFAELLLQEAKEKQRTIVIVNLSFIPQVWSDDSSINLINVSKSHERATQLAKERRAREEIIREQKRIEAEKAKQLAEKSSPRTVGVEINDGTSVDIPNPTLSPFRFAQDLIFQPLAAISNILRFFSGPALMGAIGIILLVGAVVMFPELKQKWKSMNALGAQLNVTQDIKDALLKKSAGAPNAESINPNISNGNQDQTLANAPLDEQKEVRAETTEESAPALQMLDSDQAVEKNYRSGPYHLRRPVHFRNQSYLSAKIRRLSQLRHVRLRIAKHRLYEALSAATSRPYDQSASLSQLHAQTITESDSSAS